MLSIKNLSFSYSRKKEPVIRDFSLDIPSGGIYGLLGSNGVGKSTLLYLISGLLTPGQGSVDYKGENPRLRLPSTISDIFLVPEEMDLPSMPLLKFVELNSPFYPNFSKEEMLANLEIFNIDPQIHLGGLSMGQKKKIILSFALAANTGLLLMDEPTNGLDIPGKGAFRSLIARHASDDRIFIISTHQVRDVEQILDHILIIDRQCVLFDQSVASVQNRLKFINTIDPQIINSALFAIRGPQGSSVVIPNLDGNDTEVDLEVLFSFAQENPSGLNSVF